MNGSSEGSRLNEIKSLLTDFLTESPLLRGTAAFGKGQINDRKTVTVLRNTSATASNNGYRAYFQYTGRFHYFSDIRLRMFTV